MRYVGIQTQIRRNNRMSVVLLLMFPLIILGTIWVFLALVHYFSNYYYDAYGNMVNVFNADIVNGYFLETIPYVFAGVGIWFFIAYFANTAISLPFCHIKRTVLSRVKLSIAFVNIIII